MVKFLMKNAFGYSVLAEMQPGDQVKIACNTWLECNSVKSMTSQYRKAHPREDISRYPVNIETQKEGFIVTVTAVA